MRQGREQRSRAVREHVRIRLTGNRSGQYLPGPTTAGPSRVRTTRGDEQFRTLLPETRIVAPAGAAVDVPGAGERCLLLATAVSAPEVVAALPGMPEDALARLRALRTPAAAPGPRIDDIAAVLQWHVVDTLLGAVPDSPVTQYVNRLLIAFPGLPPGTDLPAELAAAALDWNWRSTGPATAELGDEGVDLGSALMAVLGIALGRTLVQVRTDAGDQPVVMHDQPGTEPIYVAYSREAQHYQAWCRSPPRRRACRPRRRRPRRRPVRLRRPGCPGTSSTAPSARSASGRRRCDPAGPPPDWPPGSPPGSTGAWPTCVTWTRPPGPRSATRSPPS